MRKREKFLFNQDLIAENRRLKEALAACQGILEVRDAALAAAEAMGLSYEVLGLFSAGLTLVLALVRAIWVHYRGTPFVVDRIDRLTIFNAFIFNILYIRFALEAESFMHPFTKYFFILFLSIKDPAIHALFYKLYNFIFLFFIQF